MSIPSGTMTFHFYYDRIHTAFNASCESILTRMSTVVRKTGLCEVAGVVLEFMDIRHISGHIDRDQLF